MNSCSLADTATSNPDLQHVPQAPDPTMRGKDRAGQNVREAKKHLKQFTSWTSLYGVFFDRIVRGPSMDKRKLVSDSLLGFILCAAPMVAFGQAAAEAGLLSNMSATSTSSAASSLSAATNRALQGQSHRMSATTVSHTAATTTAHRTQPTSKVSAAGTKNGHSAVATTTDQGAKLPNGIAHVWPEGALTQSPAQPQ
jgi:hypothetical protein